MKKQKLPSVVALIILTTITALFWVGLNVYRTLTKEPTAKVPQDIIKPFSPVLDIETLDHLDAKLYFTEDELGEIVSPTMPVEVEEEILEEEVVGEAEEATESAEEETEATESAETTQ